MADYAKHFNDIYLKTGRGTGFEMVYPELLLPDSPLKIGSKGKKVTLLQEWLCLNGCNTTMDGQFGPATEASVREFQTKKNLDVTGVVYGPTWAKLVAPMESALKGFYIQGRTFAKLCADVAFWRHLGAKPHPRELGANRGPWVRLYMTPAGEGNPWCAGFVTFVMLQVAHVTGLQLSIAGSWSCDVLAAQGKEFGKFIKGSAVIKNPAIIKPGDIFLVRKNDKDWTHTGFVYNVANGYVETIEGNTNDEGSREGYEVCLRRRGFKNLDFISI